MDTTTNAPPKGPERDLDLEQTLELSGKILIAMPDMGDPRFTRSVILICAHSDEGAMGLMINQTNGDIKLSDLADQLDLTLSPDFRDSRVHAGGPVETERGFVLHSQDYASPISTLPVTADMALTGTLDILEDIAQAKGPAQTRIVLGYCGWGPGQLEGEIAQNAWLIGDAPYDLIFATPDAEKWQAALANENLDALTLSSTAGHA